MHKSVRVCCCMHSLAQAIWWRCVEATESETCNNAVQYMRPETIDIMKSIKRRYSRAARSSSAVAQVVTISYHPFNFIEKLPCHFRVKFESLMSV